MAVQHNPVVSFIRLLRDDIRAYEGWMIEEEAISMVREIWSAILSNPDWRSLVDRSLNNVGLRTNQWYRAARKMENFIEKHLHLLAEAGLMAAAWTESGRFGTLAVNSDGSVGYFPKLDGRSKLDYLTEGWDGVKHGRLALR